MLQRCIDLSARSGQEDGKYPYGVVFAAGNEVIFEPTTRPSSTGSDVAETRDDIEIPR